MLNAVVPGDIAGIEYDSEGHITAVPADGKLDRDGSACWNCAFCGGVYVPVGADVGLVVNAASGELTHEASSVTLAPIPGHCRPQWSCHRFASIEVADLLANPSGSSRWSDHKCNLMQSSRQNADYATLHAGVAAWHW